MNTTLEKKNTVEERPPVLNSVRQQAWHQRLRRSGFFLVAVLMHLILFSLVATWVIFRSPAPEQEASFKSVSVPVKVTPPPAPPAGGDAASNPQLEPQTVVVPVVTPPSAITTTVSTFKVDTSKVVDQTLNHIPSPVVPQGSGLSAAGGGGTTGAGSLYGSGTGSAQDLVGYLYDLKQTPDRKPTDIMGSPKAGLEFLRSWVKDWDMGALNKFYKAPNPLYATQIFIPSRKSEESTRAFGVDGVVQAKRWIIVYSTKVVPPETGTFRFVGWADDFMMVRWNGTNVLDASYPSEELDPSATADKADIGFNNWRRYGNWIQMQEGVAVPIQILIGEGPGGDSGFTLMIQKQGNDAKNGDDPVFQLKDAPIPDYGKGFSKKKMLFQEAS